MYTFVSYLSSVSILLLASNLSHFIFLNQLGFSHYFLLLSPMLHRKVDLLISLIASSHNGGVRLAEEACYQSVLLVSSNYG